MNHNLVIASAALAAACVFSSCSNTAPTDYTAYVDPFIGTGGHGHTFPGSIVPNSMIQPSPDTRIDGWDACSGYYYEDTRINGFSQNHLSGTGCCDYGEILIMPVVGKPSLDGQCDTLQNLPWASEFSHEREVATPGYYSVHLDTYDIKVETTATDRVALYRFTFPAAEDPQIIVDMDYALQRQFNQGLGIEALSDTKIRGWRESLWWVADQKIFFEAEFSQPFTMEILNDTIINTKGKPHECLKAVLSFPEMKAGDQLMAKIATSAIDYDGATVNLATMAGWDFDGTRAAAKDKWNEYLSKIEVPADADEHDLKVFYTAMYHTGVSPYLLTDADGRYIGMDHKPHTVEPGKTMYTVFSLWDTHRALHPLLSIIDPQANNDYINSLMAKADECGILPMWELGGNDSGCMIGYHAVSLMADAITKGQADFDIVKAMKQGVRSAEYDTTGIYCYPTILPQLMPQSKYYKNKFGYTISEKDVESVAKGLEYAYNDWCISLIAEAAGDKELAAKYAELGKAYKHYWDENTQFMRGKMLDGSWREPFIPNSSDHRNDDYCEGTAWQWSWFVPHDPEGLMELMGGKENFQIRLDSLFTASSELVGEVVSSDITGLIGQYAHGNEPSHHIIHFYNYADQPWKTQGLVDQVYREQYRAEPDGLSGNEDCGQMSAWLIMNAMGIYQVAPGKPVYSIGRPLFADMTVHLGNGKDLRIKVDNFSKENKYISALSHNGQSIDTPFITHEQLMQGGTLTFTMCPTPTQWGVKSEE